jgi:hypothetical protein
LSMRTLIHALTVGALVAAALASPGALAKPMGIVLPPKGPLPIPGVPVKPPPIPGVPVKPPTGVFGIVIPHPHPDPDDHWGWWHHRRPSRWMVEGGYTVPTGTAPMATPSVSGPCTCLTKTYLGDGRVEFQDICTKEAAIAAPGS